MKLHEISLAVLVMVIIIYGTTAFINDVGQNYGRTADLSSINKTLVYAEKVQNDSQKLADSILDIKVSSVVEVIEIPYELLVAGWYGVVVFFRQFEIITSIIGDLHQGFQEQGIALPGWVASITISMVIIVVCAAILYGIYKWKFED